MLPSIAPNCHWHLLLVASTARHHIQASLNLSKTAMSSCTAASADFSATELVCEILSIMRNRNKMVDWTAICLNNKNGWWCHLYWWGFQGQSPRGKSGLLPWRIKNERGGIKTGQLSGIYWTMSVVDKTENVSGRWYGGCVFLYIYVPCYGLWILENSPLKMNLTAGPSQVFGVAECRGPLYLCLI